jgi:hypothetical protein
MNYLRKPPVRGPVQYQTGHQFHCDGTDLYDDGRHLGRLVFGTKQIALYRERKEYLSTRYRHHLMQWVLKQTGWPKTEIIWF